MRIQCYKKIVVLFSFASVLLTGCTTSFPETPVYDLSPATPSIGNNEGRRNGVREPILVFVHDQNYDVETRGTGAFDAPNDTAYNAKLAKSRFFIYAFRHTPKYIYMQGTIPERFKVAADLRKSYLANELPDSKFRDKFKYDCLFDGKNYNEGLEMKLDTLSTNSFISNPLIPVASDVEDSLYYNLDYPTLPYNFFGYYIDDIKLAKADCHRESDSIWFENFTISGTQDVLCGKAPLLTDSILKSKYKEKYTSLTSAEQDTIKGNEAYSSFTASCDIAPQIEFQHQLVYLKFIAVPCDPASDSIYINGISVEGPTKGKFIVAHVNPDAIGINWDKKSVAPLALCEPSVNGGQCLPLDTTKYGMKCTDDDIAKDKEHEKDGGWIWRAKENYPGTKRIGGALLLAPATSYIVKLDCKQVMQRDAAGNPTEWRDYTSQYTISNDFIAGMAYTIQIGVFGIQHIEFGFDIEPWTPGAPISIDPDNADSEGY